MGSPALAVERGAFHVPIERVERVGGGDVGAAIWEQREADDVAAAEDEFGFSILIDARNAAAAGERTGDVEIAGLIEGEALRAAQAAIERWKLRRPD